MTLFKLIIYNLLNKFRYRYLNCTGQYNLESIVTLYFTHTVRFIVKEF